MLILKIKKKQTIYEGSWNESVNLNPILTHFFSNPRYNFVCVSNTFITHIYSNVTWSFVQQTDTYAIRSYAILCQLLRAGGAHFELGLRELRDLS